MSWSVGDALGYGWARIRGGSTRAYVVGVLPLALGLVVAVVAAGALRAGLVDTSTSLGPTLVVSALALSLLVAVAQVLGAGYLRAALAVVDHDEELDPAVARSLVGLGPVVSTSLLVALGTFVGALLCYLPGVAVAFLGQWAVYFVVDRGLGPQAAIRASIDLVRTRLTESLVWFVIAGLVVAAGAAFFGVGLLLALPVVVVGGAWSYRTLAGVPAS